ncbi:MAG TPA: DUF1906 domain-containing protein [Solirubrobacterales bacterium]|jgi:hypothetical protein|nr:DUF1906 domain-containing protein [Solirubrobacterales bacterium]
MRAFAAALLLLAAASPAAALGADEVVHYRGHEVRAPASWPVFRLSRHPRMCVRLDRRAVYLGTPAASQRCPADAIGRRRAILVAPGVAARPSTASGGAATPGGSTASSGSGAPFTGLGFDACSTPSARTMSAWSSSPYRSLGIYIGGINSACSQPNLTPRWMSTEVAAGWHPIPLYVGLQAPTSGCGSCAKLSSSQATGQGTAAASDAVEKAASVGIGAGSPIYFDMEGYTRGSSASRATLTFLAAWTSRLHVLGYVSGVYSSSASGIADLASEIGTGYALPDDIWTANWNGQVNALDPYLPSSGWARHQRLHQYRGAHNETYGGVTINIDNDFVEGATVGSAAPPPPSLPPLTVSGVKSAGGMVSVTIRCGWPAGETCPGQIVVRSNVRVAVRVRRGGAGSVKTKIVRVAVARRGFQLAGGRSHAFAVALNARGRPLLRASGTLKAQLLVAIPGARATRAVELRRGG